MGRRAYMTRLALVRILLFIVFPSTLHGLTKPESIFRLKVLHFMKLQIETLDQSQSLPNGA